MDNNQDYLNLLRKINSRPGHSQRKLADDLEFSLGKLNYCIKALKKKGINQNREFQKKPKKNKLYLQTYTQGISEKAKLTLNFMQRKMKEFDELKREYEEFKKKNFK